MPPSGYCPSSASETVRRRLLTYKLYRTGTVGRDESRALPLDAGCVLLPQTFDRSMTSSCLGQSGTSSMSWKFLRPTGSRCQRCSNPSCLVLTWVKPSWGLHDVNNWRWSYPMPDNWQFPIHFVRVQNTRTEMNSGWPSGRLVRIA